MAAPATITSSSLRGQRVRFGSLPKPPEAIQVPYARSRPELADLSCGQQTMVIAEHPAFDSIVGRICRELDERRIGTRGPSRFYTAMQCELVLLYKATCGLRSYKETRDRLAGDRAEDARRLFGLVEKQMRPQAQKLRRGIPSESTISRHVQRFGEKRRMGAYERLARALVNAHLTGFPEMREESRILTLDGSKIETHFTAPVVNKQTGEIVNADQVTAPEAGYVPREGEKGGHGWNSLTPVTLTGLPLTSMTVPLYTSEKDAGAEVINQLDREVGHLLDPDSVHVVVMDGGFNSPQVRRACQEGGFVGQVHYASHVDVPRSRKHAARRNAASYAIEGYPNWTMNGHRELSCKCGQHQISKRISRRAGEVTVRTEGKCPTCGTISITAGLWRVANTLGNVKKMVRVQPGEEHEADLSFGNPLTFNDKLARIYGRKRFAHNEGFHGQLTQRFNLYKGKRWFRRTAQVRTEKAVVFSIIHALAMEQRTRAALAPPG